MFERFSRRTIAGAGRLRLLEHRHDLRKRRRVAGQRQHGRDDEEDAPTRWQGAQCQDSPQPPRLRGFDRQILWLIELLRHDLHLPLQFLGPLRRHDTVQQDQIEVIRADLFEKPLDDHVGVWPLWFGNAAGSNPNLSDDHEILARHFLQRRPDEMDGCRKRSRGQTHERRDPARRASAPHTSRDPCACGSIAAWRTARRAHADAR